MVSVIVETTAKYPVGVDYKPEFDSYFEFRTLADSEFRVKIAKTGRALSSNFYDENRFSQVKCELLHKKPN
ncbi:MAG: hypothetical protein ACI8ZN_000517 [Bacteroidia bacterium]|jgi:hypothetical protein